MKNTTISDEKTFKNTFWPDCGNKELTVNGIIAILRAGGDIDVLPPEIQDAVTAEMDRRDAAGELTGSFSEQEQNSSQ